MSVATARVPSKKQTLDEAYSPPANFLEIDVADPATHGFAKTRYTDYEIRMKTNLPVFKMKVSGLVVLYIEFKYTSNVCSLYSRYNVITIHQIFSLAIIK